MRRLAALLLFFSMIAAAQEPASHHKLTLALFRISQAALAAGNCADVASSLGRQETNPVLGRGQFGGRQIAIKAAIIGGIMLGQEIVAHKLPAARSAFAAANIGMTGYLGWQAKQNLNYPKLSRPAQSPNSTR
jgi:hypothetical protein